ncbi:hypothetical protein ACOT1K_10230 [Providencia manganoxydans]|uniref:hypothetical protein n=1 Tax=Providencia manganoxydans TaxID=2923283 RepID=UPI003B9D7B79
MSDEIIQTKNNRNRTNKAKQAEKQKKLGFSTIEIRLGEPTYKKLEEIYKNQQGVTINRDHKDINALSQVISYCINKVYEKLYLKNSKAKLPNILPANTKDSQEFFDLYQAVKFLNDSKDVKNNADIKKIMLEYEFSSPNDYLTSGHRRTNLWSTTEIDDLLDVEILNESIDSLNKKNG